MKITVVKDAFLPLSLKWGTAEGKIWFGRSRKYTRPGCNIFYVSDLRSGLSAEKFLGGVQHRRARNYDAPKVLSHLKARDALCARRGTAIHPKSGIVVTNAFWSPLLRKLERPSRISMHAHYYLRGPMKCDRRAVRLPIVSGVIARAKLNQTSDLKPRVPVLPDSLSLVVPTSPAAQAT